ncbi:MAG: zinc-ribbon domain containing protein [Planctomycetes bacterium]|nr:zinc-ribbon domain containing protein [Planctomycetota bacterium]
MFQDKNLTCVECGTSFVFTADDQEFHQKKGYTSEPKRCPECRKARRRAEGGGGGGGGGGGMGGGMGRSDRPMFTATCASCGGKADVPFEPKQNRPVYCRDCYSKVKSSRY